MKKYLFKVEDCFYGIVGYSDNVKWNGWECPYFEKEVVDLLIQNQDVIEGYKPYYDEENDCYVFTDQFDVNHCVDKYYGINIKYNGKIIHVYDIGYGSWTWEKEKEL